LEELFRELNFGSRVLDLGCAAGSFDSNACPGRVVRADLDAPAHLVHDDFVRTDAAALPFPNGCFDVIVCNHSVEHFADLPAALAEIRRVLAPGGLLFVSVPDASTLTDRLYRWLARGGGHLNAFRSFAQLVSAVESGASLHLLSARVLCTSLSFLNRRNHPSRPPRKLWLLGGGAEPALRWLTRLFRLSDRWLGSRASVYGWRCTFGPVAPPRTPECEPPWTNVCIRCGSGHPSDSLSRDGASYSCPNCRARNFFTDDDRYAQLR
jgi:SAM-dependent methyltransferase